MRKIRREQLFRGYSSIGKTNPYTEITDIELIKRDLLNHFHTSKGERVMRPEFGSIIWNLLFEPFDATIREAVISDVENIIAQDPRVELQSLDVLEYDHGLRVDISVLYVPLNAYGQFEVEFDRRNNIQRSVLAEEVRN